MSGKLTREEVAEVVSAALESPHAVGKTFELRRAERNIDVGDELNGSAAAFGDVQFMRLAKDKDRTARGLGPLPAALPPPPPPSVETVKEVMADPRVKAATGVDGRGGRDRDTAGAGGDKNV